MSNKVYRKRRSVVVVIIGLVIAGGIWWQAGYSGNNSTDKSGDARTTQNVNIAQKDNSTQPLATDELAKLPIKGRAPKTGYSREQFGGDWAKWGKCDVREQILQRDLTDIKLGDDGCTVESGVLEHDPYSGKTINFTRGTTTSSAIQIDHVVAISDAWQTGAQQLSKATREQMYQDPLELIAVDGPTNNKKSDGDAATWLPPNKSFRCQYVARQIAVKVKYSLWVTSAEHDAMAEVIATCPSERLPEP